MFESLKFVSDAFDFRTALFPGLEDATCESFTNGVVVVPSFLLVCAGVGVGVGVGVGWVGMVGVRVVGWRVANELMDKKMLVRSVLSKVEELLFNVFDELAM